MKTVSEYDCKMPEYAMSYLHNADSSGLNDEDIANIDEYMQQFYNEAEKCKGHVIIGMPDDDDPYFTWSPDFGLACDVYDIKILVVR